MALKGRADAVGKEMGDQTVEGLAFGRERAPFGGRNARGDFAERLRVGARRQAVIVRA